MTNLLGSIVNSKLFIAPHNDDEVLFGAYTIMREKPLVLIVTDSYIQQERGDKATTEQRIAETKEAMKLLGVEVEFLHIPDKSFTEDKLIEKLVNYEAETVYAPAVEKGGNWIHNAVGKVVSSMFWNVKRYNTYVSGNDKTQGNILIIPTREEKELKRKALACYKSQLSIPTCANFFKHKEILEYESYE